MADFTPENDDAPIIGIDLGTTFSCVAAYDKKVGKVVVLSNSIGERTTPSWVAFTQTGRVVGQAAKTQASMNANNTIYDVKRIIGRSMEDPVTREESRRFPFLILDGGDGRPMIEVDWRTGKHRMSPEEVSSMVLLEMKRAAEAALECSVSKAVITVPAHFNDQQRQATKDAGRIAGLNVVRIINEPTAAALAYGLHNSGKEADKTDKPNVVIFDLGGGTFDVSILSMEGGVFQVKATGGDTHLGGEDFDNALVDWCLKIIEEKHGKDNAKAIKASQKQRQRLRRSCEQAKRNLSTSNSSEIEVDGLLAGGETFSHSITRTDFDKLAAPLIKRCMDTVKAVIKDAGATLETVSDLVLVGGSTRILAIQEKLLAMFGGRIELNKSINPDEAVAYGAAVQGAILQSGGSGGGMALDGICTDLLLMDVTPLSLGIELEGRVMSVLIPRNTPIPCTKSREYTTCEDWQTEIDVMVFEGERPHTSANNPLGEFKISGIERAKRGDPKVEVTFELDANGILSVRAQDKVTGAKAETQIKADKGRLTDEQVEKMIAEAEKYRAEDEALARKMHLRNALEEAVFRVKASLIERNDITGISDLDELLEWVEYESETATLADIQNHCDKLFSRFNVRVEPMKTEDISNM
jgi:L1 cell adhesion molecule like protein